MSSLPKKAKFVIIGAGIHGLSTAWNIGEKLKAKGHTVKENDIVVLDKSGVAAGASGIACGVVRNNYFQPAMRELMAHSVDVWEKDSEEFNYHSVGFMQINTEAMRKDMSSVYEQQQKIGYDSEFIEGEEKCFNYMKNIFSDWQAKGITSILHEKQGGYSPNKIAINACGKKAKNEGANVITGVEVTGFKRGSNSKAVTGVETNKGIIECEQVVVAVGPWIYKIWEMLELPQKISIKYNGQIKNDQNMWKYWFLQEGIMNVGDGFLKTDDGKMPPLIHVDSDEPFYSDRDKSLITDKMWGIYYKPDICENLGIQGGAAPFRVNDKVENVKVDPYGLESNDYQTTDDFAHMWSSALAHCQKRFEGKSHQYKKGPSGGLGCFTPDSFPVFDKFCENVYVIADSNHGYKMMGVGKLVADELLGNESQLLKPFRFNRYEKGELHPTSNSPFPWS